MGRFYTRKRVRHLTSPRSLWSWVTRPHIHLILRFFRYLSDGPGALGVHGRVRTARVRELARQFCLDVVAILLGVQGFYVYTLQGEVITLMLCLYQVILARL